MDLNVPNLNSENCQDILAFLVESGKIDIGSIQDYMDMEKKHMVQKVHPYTIAQGQGKDARWYTRINMATKGGAKKKVARNTEKELYDFLYEYYYGNIRPKGKMTLPEIYPEWFQYKSSKGMDSTSMHRIDTDYKRFYVNDSLSQKLMSTPLAQIRKIDIKKWAYALIAAHDLTYKSYTNMALILKQTLEHLVDQEALENNPYDRVKIEKKAFRRVRKKAPETQIYYDDEKEQIIALAEQRAIETGDEKYYAVALFFKTGVRIGECLAFSFEDFKTDRHVVHVHASLKAVEKQRADGTWETRRHELREYLKQNSDERDVLITDECFEIVEQIRQLQEQKAVFHDGYLFHAVTPSDLENKIRRLCVELNLPIRSPHKMRKTYVSTLLNNGADPDFVRAQVGHKEIQTTYNSYTYSTSRPEKQLQMLETVL